MSLTDAPRAFFLSILIACSALVAPGAGARDLGVVGPMYRIAEPDLLKVIYARLAALKANGGLALYEKQGIARARAWIKNPPPVAGLTTTNTQITYYYDPGITTTRAVTDQNGRILIPAGTHVNPLDYWHLPQDYLFFDARDKAQVKEALALYQKYDGRVEFILTGGSYIHFMRTYKIRVYYDQGGYLVRKLGITHVPALLSQDGKRLRIDELPV